MKTLKRTSGSVRLTMVVALLMLTMQSYSNTEYSKDSKFRSADSSLVVASLAYARDYYTAEVDSRSESKSVAVYELMEEDIQLEEWMLEPKHSFWANVKSDDEDEIELEDWMMDASLW